MIKKLYPISRIPRIDNYPTRTATTNIILQCSQNSAFIQRKSTNLKFSENVPMKMTITNQHMEEQDRGG